MEFTSKRSLAFLSYLSQKRHKWWAEGQNDPFEQHDLKHRPYGEENSFELIPHVMRIYE